MRKNLIRAFVVLLAMMLPLTGMAKKKQEKVMTDREYWCSQAYKMAQPVLENMAKGELQKNMQLEVSPNWDGRNKKVAYIMLDPGYLKSYEVVFDDATKVEFNKKGQWKEVDMNTQAVPSEFIPEAIQAYVNTAFPDAFICHIDVEKGKKEVKLSNGLELKFNKRNLLMEVDD